MKKWIFSIFIAAAVGYSIFAIESDKQISVKDRMHVAPIDQFHAGHNGITRYRISGEGKAVILIHAFNGFLDSWNPNVTSLVNAGYKVVTYDLWGRGLSDRPLINYELADFRNQLHDIIKLSGNGSVHLVGASFGSVIAADYALHYPDQVDKVVFIGPAGWPDDNSSEAAFLGLPVLPDVIFSIFGKQIIEPMVEAYLHDPDAHKWAIERWSEYAALPSFGRVVLSTMRNSPVRDYTEGWSDFGRLNKPNMFIWGKQDVSFPLEHSIKAKLLVPNTKVIEVDGAAHWVNIEKADIVNSAIIDFLGS
ncbi:MAG: alpha/beta hydrolase [Pseudomonadota bacterium]|nr:alpha/beta hydrolase [Pseudomonadota bacterium]